MGKAIVISPQDIKQFEKAKAFEKDGHLLKAKNIYRKLNRKHPSAPDIVNGLASVAFLGGDYQNAIKWYSKLLELVAEQPAKICFNIAVSYRELERFDQSSDWFRQVITHDPRHPEAHLALAKVLIKSEGAPDFKGALVALSKDIELSARMESYHMAADILSQQKYWQQGRVLLSEALRGEPLNEGCLYRMADNLLHENLQRQDAVVGDIEQVLKLVTILLDLDPDNWKVHLLRGNACNMIGEFDLALKSLMRVVALNSEAPLGHMNMGLALLSRGEFDLGWSEMCWRRVGTDRKYGVDAAVIDACDSPLWEGEQTPGARLLITGEQGIGDQLLHAQMVMQLLEQGLEITLTCNPKILTLMQSSFPGATIYPQGVTLPAEELARIDYKGTMFDLGRIMRRSWTDFDKPRRFLVPDAGLVEQFREKYRHFDGVLKVGISWKSTSPASGVIKSTDLLQWQDVLAVPGVQFFSLQYDDVEEDVRQVLDKTGVDIFVDDFDPFDDLDKAAAQIACMDVVISVSNVAAHMAGQLNVPTLLLLPLHSLWHWFLDRRDSLWYDNFALYRKSQLQSWQPLLAQLAGDLSVLVADHRVDMGLGARGADDLETGGEALLDGR